jgi:tRNA dimethylallyltransferase
VSPSPEVLVIGGPTASGKTGLAIRIAQRTGAVIVSADAMQVYRGMDIGTGKATVEERGGITHFGVDLRDPDEAFDVADFIRVADHVIAEHDRVIVVGGTSLYLRGLIRGLVETPPVVPALRAELEAAPDLHHRLEEVDPVLAARLHPNDRVRLVRGMEVFLSSGERLSALQEAHSKAPDRYRTAGFWLDRGDLYDRIDRRVLEMIEGGYCQEVENLLAAGYHRRLKPMQSLGYRHLCAHLLEGLALDEAVALTQRDTRRFARKQRTWHKNFALLTLNDDFTRAEDFAW